MIIGILGRSRVGKDTVAQIIVDTLKNTETIILRLSQPLKDAVKALYGFSSAQLEDDSKDTIDKRFGITPREVIQHICQDTMLRHGDDFFSKKVFDYEIPKHKTKTIIIPDVRYAHDIYRIQKEGGFVIKVTRPNGPQPIHLCESPIDEMKGDYHIENDSNIEKLRHKVINILQSQQIK